jgi:peptidoglycan/LPS O-acetylase OafA/YrhL
MLAMALGLAVIRYVMERKLPVAMPLALAVMFWGFCWRRYTVDRLPGARAAALSVTAALVVMIPPICILAYSSDYGYGENWQRYVATYLAAIFIFVVLTTKVKVATPITLYLGAISYSVYLFGPIGQEIAQYIVAGAGVSVPGHLIIALAVAITVAISALVYAFVEKPSIELGRRINERAARRLATSSRAAAQNPT